MTPFLFKLLIFLFLVFILIPSLSPAVENAVEIKNPLEANTFKELINNIINFLFNLALIVTPLMIIIAGVLFITSVGNPQQIQQAKNLILYTLIGFVIILIAKGFIEFFTKALKVK